MSRLLFYARFFPGEFFLLFGGAKIQSLEMMFEKQNNDQNQYSLRKTFCLFFLSFDACTQNYIYCQPIIKTQGKLFKHRFIKIKQKTKNQLKLVVNERKKS